jgi:putative nucleotidyltransferase with HDIG domain
MLHFVSVGLAALLATVAAVALTIIGARRSDSRTVWLGMGFSVMAALLAVHGFATPGIFVAMNGVVAFSGAATLPLGGAVLALAAVPQLSRPRSVKALVWAEVALVFGIVALGAIGMTWPNIVPAVPEERSPAAFLTLAAGLSFFGLVGWRALRTFRLTRRPSDLSVAVGIVWLGAALVPALTLGYSDFGWWLGHWFELFGLVLVGAPVAIDMFRDSPSRPLAGDMRAAALVTSEEAYLGTQVRALTRRLAERDQYTAEHTRRVALRAVQVGERLGLSPERLRTLAAGGLLHDMGKLATPLEILTKPSGLTDEEFATIKEHPRDGYELLTELGFPEAVRRLVLDHHERLDGSGYPRRIDSDHLPLETRIMAACDVYDALISRRVYRDAWPHERAIALLREEEGDRFDQRVVETLAAVIEAELPAEEGRKAAKPAPALILAADTGGGPPISGR